MNRYLDYWRIRSIVSCFSNIDWNAWSEKLGLTVEELMDELVSVCIEAFDVCYLTENEVYSAFSDNFLVDAVKNPAFRFTKPESELPIVLYARIM
jgi:hypothetical protein